jgi:hypothetical protein
MIMALLLLGFTGFAKVLMAATSLVLLYVFI